MTQNRRQWVCGGRNWTYAATGQGKQPPEATKGKNQEITAAWPLSKNPLLDFSYDYRAYAPLGDSHLPPTDSANSQNALEHEKEAWIYLSRVPHPLVLSV